MAFAGNGVDRPIFIVAPPRCGTTLLYGLLAHHPLVGHFNRADRLFPEWPRLAALLTRLRLIRDSPRESRALWFRFLGKGELDLAEAADVTPEARDWFHWRIAASLAARGASRFAAKLPAHTAQVGYLRALFPDARFLQPLRDWRAVVASTVVKRERDFPGRWFGVRLDGWRAAAALPPHLGAAWQYRAAHEYLARKRAESPAQFLSVRYDELLGDPATTMRRVFEFCGLESSPALEARAVRDVRPGHERWREVLTPDKLAEIEREHGAFLAEHVAPGAAPPILTAT
jgi:Sulfotransferase family